MSLYEDMKNKSDKELLEILEKQSASPLGSPAGAEETKKREFVKAILNYRNSNSMIRLTKSINLLTIIMVILTLVTILLY